MSQSTAPPPPSPSVRRLERRLRTAAVSVLGAVLVGGVVGVFGTREARSEASAGGIALEVTWPRATRAGLPLAVGINVSSNAPLPPRIIVSLSSSYAHVIEGMSVVPAHRSERTAPDRLAIEVESEPGQRSTEIRVEGRVPPSARGVYEGTIRVEPGPGLELSTFVWP